MPAHRDPIDGTPVIYPAGFRGPLTSTVTDFYTHYVSGRDPVREELYQRRYEPPTIPWIIGKPEQGPLEALVAPPDPREGVPLTPQERDRWATLMTQGVRINDRTLPEALQHLMAPDSKYWEQSQAPGGGREILLRTVFNTYHRAAADLLRDPRTGSPDLARALVEREEALTRSRLPKTHPESPEYRTAEGAERRTPVADILRRGAQRAERRLTPSLGR